jgi:glycosyltransferase involved in cell wall biosynthesis
MLNYVLVTAARNEGRFIERTLQSVVAQTRPPSRWVIVDDGSTDETPDLVDKYAREYPWIQLVRRSQRLERSFAGKADAVNAAVAGLKDTKYDVIGNLDADVSFGPNYMEFVVERFSDDPKLGVAGTPFTEEGDYDSTKDSFEGENYVAGPCQLFRRQCFGEIGGYLPNRAGGVDWIAVMTARMKGWKVRSFPEKRFHHHRSMGTAQRSPFSALFSYGEKDYYLGGSPVWQLFRVVYRMGKKPMLTGGLALLFGYCWAALRRVKRPVSPELMQFHRRDQMHKLQNILRSLFAFQKVDSFRSGSGEEKNQKQPASR